jgi:NDP-sugar pyrophosphorylase family protein
MFFEKIEEKIAPIFKTELPWEPLKFLKEFLNDIIPELPSSIPLKTPVSEPIFLTTTNDVIPLRELEETEEGFFLKGELVKGAVINAGTVFLSKKVYLGDGVIVEPFAYINGPAYFSEKTQVRHSAYVRGSVYTGKGAVIGHTTEVKNSIFFSEAKAAHFAYVGDSILGKNVNLGAGTKLANLKFTKKEIVIEYEGEKYKTGLKKFGAIIGDGAQTGCNSVLQPGTLLGKRSFVFPAKVAGPGVFPPESKIK